MVVAIAAPAAEPFDELFAFIDDMTIPDAMTLIGRLRHRVIEPEDDGSTVDHYEGD